MKLDKKTMSSLGASVVGGGITISVPLIFEHSPAQLASGLTPWWPVFLKIEPWLLALVALSLLFSLVRQTYLIGVRYGQRQSLASSMSRDGSTPYSQLPASGELVAAEAIVAGEEAKRLGNGRADIVYRARLLTSLLLQKGTCRAAEASGLIKNLERPSDVWHDKRCFEAREKYLEAARHALEVRWANGNSKIYHAGDYTDGQRRSFEGLLKQRLRVLESVIEGRPAGDEEAIPPTT